jgi:outer membrane protein TolC
MALENNPELQASHYLHEKAKERITEAGSLPNTTIGAGFFLQEAETRVGPQKAKFSVMQQLPWFGTLESREKGAGLKAASAANETEQLRRKFIRDVKEAYFTLYENLQLEKIVLEHREILDSFEELALTALENNRATMVDVLRIRMEKNELANRLYSLEEGYKSNAVTFNLLLNREAHLPVVFPDAFDLQTDGMETGSEALNDNPLLLRLENQRQYVVNEETVVKKERLPSIGLGLDYVFVGERPVTALPDNGKNIVMPMLSLSVPLFSKKYTSRLKQLELERQALESSRTGIENTLMNQLQQAKSDAKVALATINTQEQNIAEADRAREVLLAAYQTSMIDFEQLLEIQQMKLQFQIKDLAAKRNYAVQLAIINYLTQSL